MTKPPIERDLVTADEFFALVPDGQKADLIDGVIYMASPDTLRNDQLARFIGTLMFLFAEARNLGKVFGSRFAFQLSDLRAPEPDVAFVSSRRMHLVQEKRVIGGPDIAVEIVSRDSRSRDYVDKKQLYQEAGTPEYWIQGNQDGDIAEHSERPWFEDVRTHGTLFGFVRTRPESGRLCRDLP